MATKGKEVKEEIDDDYSFDDDMDMGDFDLDFSEPKDDRSPISVAGSGALEGALEGFFDTQFLGEKLKDTLHPGYGKTLDMADYLGEKAGKTYADSVKAAKPAVDQFKRTMLEVVPKDARYVPDFLKEKLEEWKGERNQPTAEQSIAQAREEMLANQLGSIFSAQLEQTDQIRQEDNYKEAAQENVDQARHKQNVGMASEQGRAVSRIDQYLRSVNLEWQKKELELGYRQLFALQDLLVTTKNVGQITIDNLPLITKNTALPDFVKQTSKEFLAEYQKNKFIDAIGSGLFGSTSEYLEKGLNKLSTNISKGIGDYAKELQGGIAQLGGIFSMGASTGERTEGIVGRAAGGMAGGSLLESLFGYVDKDKRYADPERDDSWLEEHGGKAYTGLRKAKHNAQSWISDKTDWISENETANKYGRKLTRGVRNAGSAVADKQREWVREGDDGTLIGKFKSLFARSFGNPSDKQEIGVKNSNTLIAPHDITFKTINEIMPGYMSRMLNELVLIRKGQQEDNDVQGERLVYDHDKNDFVSRSVLKENLTEKMASNSELTGLESKLAKLLELMDAKGLPPPVQKSLREAIVRAKIDKRSPTEENLTDFKYYKGEGKQAAKQFMESFVSGFATDEDTRDKFEIAYHDMLAGMRNHRQDISNSVTLSQSSELRELGFLNKDNLYDSQSVGEHYLGRLKDPEQIKKEKKRKKNDRQLDLNFDGSPPGSPPVPPRPAPPSQGDLFSDTPQPFAKGGVLQSLSDLSGKVTSSPQKFLFANGGKVQTGLLGEAGTEAILPAQGGVQAVNADGQKAGKLQLARDGSGKLSVQLPERPGPEQEKKKGPYSQLSKPKLAALKKFMAEKETAVMKLTENYQATGELNREGISDALGRGVGIFGHGAEVKRLSWDDLDDNQLLELYEKFYLTAYLYNFYKENGDKSLADQIKETAKTQMGKVFSKRKGLISAPALISPMSLTYKTYQNVPNKKKENKLKPPTQQSATQEQSPPASSVENTGEKAQPVEQVQEAPAPDAQEFIGPMPKKQGLYTRLSSTVKSAFNAVDTSGAKKVFDQARSGDIAGAIGSLASSGYQAGKNAIQETKEFANSETVANAKKEVGAKMTEVAANVKEEAQNYTPEMMYQKGLMRLSPQTAKEINEIRRELQNSYREGKTEVKEEIEELLKEHIPDYEERIKKTKKEIDRVFDDPKAVYGDAKDSAKVARDKALLRAKQGLLEFVGEEDAAELTKDFLAGREFFRENGKKAVDYLKEKSDPYLNKVTDTEAYQNVKGQVGKASAKVSEKYDQTKQALSDTGDKITAINWSGSEKAQKDSDDILSQMNNTQLSKEVFRQNYIGRVGELTKHYAHVLNPRESKKFVEFGQQKLADYISKNGEPETPEQIEKFEKEVFGEYKEYLETVEDSYQGLKGFGKNLWSKISNFFSALGGNLSTLFGDAMNGVEDFLSSASLKLQGGGALEFKKQLEEISKRYGPYTPEEEKAFVEFSNKSAQEYQEKNGKPKNKVEQEAMFNHALQISEDYLAQLRGQKPQTVEVKTATNTGEKAAPANPNQALAPKKKSWVDGIKEKYQEHKERLNPKTLSGELLGHYLQAKPLTTEVIEKAKASNKNATPHDLSFADKLGVLVKAHPALTGDQRGKLAQHIKDLNHEWVSANGEAKTPEQTEAYHNYLLSWMGEFFANAQTNAGSGGKAITTPATPGTTVDAYAGQPAQESKPGLVGSFMGSLKESAMGKLRDHPVGQFLAPMVEYASERMKAVSVDNGEKVVPTTDTTPGVVSQKPTTVDYSKLPGVVQPNSALASTAKPPVVNTGGKMAVASNTGLFSQSALPVESLPAQTVNNIHYQGSKVNMNEKILTNKAGALIERYTPQLVGEDPTKFGLFAQKTLVEEANKNGQADTPEKAKKAQESVLGKFSNYLENLRKKKPNGGKLRKLMEKAGTTATQWSHLASGKANELIDAIQPTPMEPGDGQAISAQRAQENAKEALRSQLLKESEQVQTESLFKQYSGKLMGRLSALGDKFGRTKRKEQENKPGEVGKVGENTGARKIDEVRSDQNALSDDAEKHISESSDTLTEIRDTLHSIEDILADGSKGSGKKWYNPMSWRKGKGGEQEEDSEEASQRKEDRAKKRAARGSKVKRFGGGVAGFVGSVAAGATNIVGGGIKKTVGAMGWVAGKNIEAVKWVGGKTIDAIISPEDVYVQGENTPRLYGIMFGKGAYFKLNKKKEPKNHNDIDDVIVDKKGQVLIRKEELGKLYNKGIGNRMKRLGKGLFRGIGWGIEKVMGGMLNMASIVPWMAGKMWDMTTGVLRGAKSAYSWFGDGPDDVYTPGVKDPVMVKTIMKTGGYLSKHSGKPIMKPTDIDGAVIDLQGKEVLTLDQFRNGVFNVRGDKFRTTTGKIFSGLAAVGSGILKAQAAAWRASKAIAKGVFKGIGGIARWGLNGFSLEINAGKTRVVLEEIRDMLKAKFAKDNPIFGDKDGDGDKDNSAKDQMAQNKKEDEEKKKDSKEKSKKSIKERLQDRGERAKEGIMDTLGKLGATISGLADGVRGLKAIGTLFGTLLGKGGMIARIVGMGAGALGMGGAATTAGAAATAASATAAAGAVGATAATGGAVAAAGGTAAAVGGVAALPVVLAALGIAAVGYGGYKLFKWASSTSLETLDNYRLVQYGFEYGDKDNFQKVVQLEELAMKHVGSDGVIDEKKITLKDIGEIFGVGDGMFTLKSTASKEYKVLLNWYQNRFKPVFFASMQAANAVHNTQGVAAFKRIPKLKKDEAGFYLDNANPPTNAYGIGMPVHGMKPMGEPQVKQAEEKIRAEMKLPVRGESKRKGASKPAASKSAVTKEDGKKADTSANANSEKTPDKDKPVEKDNAIKQGVRIMTDQASYKAYEKEQRDKNSTSLWEYAKTAGMLGVGVAVMGLPAVALLGGGYLAYKHTGSIIEGVKDWWNRPTLDGLHLLRMVQYGYYKDDSDNHKRIAKLEGVLFEHVKKNGKGFDIDDKKLRVEYIQKIFDIDLNDQKALSAFYNWYQNRFKPVFITNLSVAQQITNNQDFAQAFKSLNDLKAGEMVTFLNKAGWPDGPYHVPCHVVSEHYPQQNANHVKDVIAWLIRDLGLKGVKATEIKDKDGKAVAFDTQYNLPETGSSKNIDTSKIGERGQTIVRSGELKSTGESRISVESLIDERLTAKDGEIDYLDEKTYSELIDLAGMKQEGVYTALQAVYYKAMGLNELEQSKIRSIQALENIVAQKTTYADGKATWTGSVLEAFEKTKGHFGITDAEGKEGKEWIEWFSKRFIPVYLKFLSLYCAYTGHKSYSGSVTALKVAQQLDLAKQIAAMDVWRYLATPWPSYLMNTDPKTTKGNLVFLEENVKKEIAAEEKAQEKKKQVGQEKSPESKGLMAALFGNKDNAKKNQQPGQAGKQQENANVPPDTEIKPTATSSDMGGSKASPGELKMASGDRLNGANGASAVGLASKDIKLSGIHPALQTLFFGMADEYRQLTGEKIIVTDGYRSYEDQVRMKQKYGARAATPGESMHGDAGIAMDADSKALDKAEKLGLMRKYGLTRPVGAEPHHVEPIGTQFDLQKYKMNASLAANAIMAGVGKGGGGYGTISGANKYTRNIDLSKSIYGANIQPNVKLEGISKEKVGPGSPPASPGNTGAGGAQAQQTPQTESAEKPKTAGAAGSGEKAAPVSSTTVDKIGSGYMGRGKTIDSGGDLLPKPTTDVSSQALAKEGKPASAELKQPGANGGVSKAPLESERKIAQVPKPDGDNMQSVKKTVEAAAKTVGIDPDIAKTTVAIESGFNPNAKASTSSASGLNQFIASTWDAVVQRYGKPYGFYPGSVSPFDPQANAIMGAHYLKENEQSLKRNGDSEVDAVDLYTAHFMGPGGANKFSKALRENPHQDATQLMPKAAAANRAIFYDLQRPKNVAEVRRTLEGKVKSKAAAFGIQAPVGASSTNNNTKAPLPGNGAEQETAVATKTPTPTKENKQTTGAPIPSVTTPSAEQSQAPTTQMASLSGKFGDRESFMKRMNAPAAPQEQAPNTETETAKTEVPGFLQVTEIKPQAPNVSGYDMQSAMQRSGQVEKLNRQENGLFAQALKPTESIMKEHLDVSKRIHETLRSIDGNIRRLSDKAAQPAPVNKNGPEKTGKELVEETQSQPEFTGRRPAMSGMNKWEIPTSRNV